MQHGGLAECPRNFDFASAHLRSLLLKKYFQLNLPIHLADGRSHARAGEREREGEPLPPAAERVHPVHGVWGARARTKSGQITKFPSTIPSILSSLRR